MRAAILALCLASGFASAQGGAPFSLGGSTGSPTFAGTATASKLVCTGSPCLDNSTATQTLLITSATNDATTSGSVAGMTFKLTSNITNSDIGWGFSDSTGAINFYITENGSGYAAGDFSSTGGVNSNSYNSFSTAATLLVNSLAADSITSTTVGAITLKANTNLTDGDLVLDVQNSAADHLLKINEQGVGTFLGAITPATDFGASLGSTALRWNGVFALYNRDADNTIRIAYDGNNATTYKDGVASPGAGSIAHIFDTRAAYGTAGGKVIQVKNNNVEMAAISKDGAYGVQGTDSSGSPGAATINKPSGKSAIAASASAVTITDSTVTANSQIYISPLGADATCIFLRVSAITAATSFVVTGYSAASVATACTGNQSFFWEVRERL